MSTLEQELIAKITRLDAENQRKVLEFVSRIEPAGETSAGDKAPPQKFYSVLELMKLPDDERDRYIKESFERAANEDFEIFEANSEEDFYDYDDE